MSHRALAALLLALLLGLFHTARAGAAGPAPLKEVRIGYFANVTHAQAVLGIHSGDFAKALAPADVKTRIFNAGPPLIEALFAGEIDIGYVGPSPALNGHLQSRGRGLRVIAGAAANGVVIIAAPGSGIARLEDLKGRRIATPQLGNTQDMSARHYLTTVLGQANADNILPIPNSEQASMMSRGQIDAAWAVEPWGARLVAEAGGAIIAEEKDLWPGGEFVLTLIVVSPEFLKSHADTVEQVLRVHTDWTRRLSADPAACAPQLTDALAELTSKRLSPEIVSDALTRVKFTDEPLAESIQTFARWSYDLGLAKGVPSITTLVDTTILDRIRAGRAESPPAQPQTPAQTPATPTKPTAPGHP
ncbi:MAG: aliphatic sulfonate ABC transporter substrate-binding protein [Phycisphaerales bacterium]|nr:aliphatic sulfonate ABC transporter substrate-binding protein [Phycisphaerales bacterium]